jgi:predicted enzyme related to lactoylglutathione lyase
MGRVVHFEIPVDDPDRARRFYESAFGWSFQGYGDQPYWLTEIGQEGDVGIEGALAGREEIHQHPVVVIGVDDIAQSVQQARKAGAEVLLERQAVPTMGWSAYVRDPEGNVVGMWQADPEAA